MPASDLTSVGWLCIRGGRLLVVRTQGREAFYLPGGKVEPQETHEQALVREVREELAVDLVPTSLHRLMVVRAPAHDRPGTELHMHCFTADSIGVPRPSNEIADLDWVQPTEAQQCAPAVVQVLHELTTRDLWH